MSEKQKLVWISMNIYGTNYLKKGPFIKDVINQGGGGFAKR